MGKCTRELFGNEGYHVKETVGNVRGEVTVNVPGTRVETCEHRKLHEKQVQSFCFFSRDFKYLLLLYFQPVRYFGAFDVTFSLFATKPWNKFD